jgi:hypothetical protein
VAEDSCQDIRGRKLSYSEQASHTIYLQHSASLGEDYDIKAKLTELPYYNTKGPGFYSEVSGDNSPKLLGRDCARAHALMPSLEWTKKATSFDAARKRVANTRGHYLFMVPNMAPFNYRA